MNSTSRIYFHIQGARRTRRSGLLGFFGPATRPFQIMSLDTIGGFGGNGSNKRYLHLLVDHFSRYASDGEGEGESKAEAEADAS